MWFSLIFLKSRDVRTWCRASKRSISHRSGILWGTFCNQPEVSVTSGSKVVAHYLFFTKVVTLTLPFIRFSKKKFCIVACLEDIFCKKNQDDRTSGAACRAFEDGQTNRQTDRGDQYTFRKSKISKSNESRSESGTTFRNDYDFTAWLTLTATCQGKRLRTWLFGWNYSKK